MQFDGPWTEVTGLERGDTLGFGWFEALHPDDRDKVARAFQSAASRLAAFRIAARLRKRDGSYQYVISAGNPQFDAQGGFRGYVGTVVENEEHRVAEEALRKSEALKSFLLRLTDALAPLGDPALIQAEACRVLGRHLGVSRVFYTEVDDEGINVAGPQYVDGVEPVEPVWHSNEFGSKLIERYRLGETVWCHDTRIDTNITEEQRASYAREEIVAWAAVPISKPGLVLGRLILNQKTPRHWTGDEITLIRETAERVWPAVQRAKAENALREKEQELLRAQAIARTGNFRHDVATGMIVWSDEACHINGMPKGSSLDYPTFITRMVHPEDREWVAQWAEGPAGDAPRGTTYDIEYRVVAGGVTKWVRERGEYEYAADGKATAGFGTLQDITDTKGPLLALRDSEERFRAFFDNIGVGASQVDRDGRFVEVNHRYCDLVGYTREQLIGKMTTADISLPGNVEADLMPNRRILSREIPSCIFDKQILRGDGSVVWARIASAPILDERGKVQMIASLVADISEQKRAEELLKESEQSLRQLNAELEARVEARTAELAAMNEALSRLARTDPLTGLPNRLSANERLRQEFLAMKRSGRSYSVLMFDLDNFKSINDTYGHAVGDLVIQSAATAAKGSIRQTDFICRFGGEEFLALLPDTDTEGARRVAEKIRKSVAAIGDTPVSQVTTSVGIALARPDQIDEGEAITIADNRLYAAKNAGRNCVIWQ